MNDKTDKTDKAAELQAKLREAEMKLRDQTIELRDVKSRSVRLAVGSAIAGFLLFAIGGQWFPRALHENLRAGVQTVRFE
jgi:hypothetical protein